MRRTYVMSLLATFESAQRIIICVISTIALIVAIDLILKMNLGSNQTKKVRILPRMTFAFAVVSQLFIMIIGMMIIAKSFSSLLNSRNLDY